MMVNSLHIHVHGIVLSGVSSLRLPSCRCVCRLGANTVHWALHATQHPAQPPHVQTSCLKRAWPAALILAVRAFAGGLAAGSAAPPGRRGREQKRQAKAEGKIKGRGTLLRDKAVCTWGWRGTRRLRLCAAWIANTLSTLSKVRASHAGLRQPWMEGLHEQQR